MHPWNVYECRYTFERATCEIHVTARRTMQGNAIFGAVAYKADDECHELVVLVNANGTHLEVTDLTARNAAERLVPILEEHFGKRLSGPDAVPQFDTPATFTLKCP